MWAASVEGPATGGTGALLVPVTEPVTRRRLTRAIDRAESCRQDAPAYTAELATWTGLDRITQDGMVAASTPPVRRTHGDTTMRTFAGGTLTEAETGHGEHDGGQLLVLATHADDLDSVLRAGEAASAALLTATDLGLATCPLSQALEIPGTRAFIRDKVLDGAACPHLVLRTGWAPTAAPPPPQSPRRATVDTVGYLPGVRRQTSPVPSPRRASSGG